MTEPPIDSDAHQDPELDVGSDLDRVHPDPDSGDQFPEGQKDPHHGVTDPGPEDSTTAVAPIDPPAPDQLPQPCPDCHCPGKL